MTEYSYCKLDVDGETIIGAVVAQPLTTDLKRRNQLERTTGWSLDLWVQNNSGSDSVIGQAGGSWDGSKFIPPQLFPSWIYNAGTNSWESPIGNPDNLHSGRWNEDTQTWWDESIPSIITED